MSSLKWEMLLRNNSTPREGPRIPWISKHLFLGGTFKQGSWEGASSLHHRQRWPFKHTETVAAADTDYYTVLFAKTSEHKADLQLWLAANQAIHSQNLHTEVQDKDQDTANKGHTPRYHLISLGLPRWSQRSLLSWSNSIISPWCTSAFNTCFWTVTNNFSTIHLHCATSLHSRTPVTPCFWRAQWTPPLLRLVSALHTHFDTAVGIQDSSTEPSLTSFPKPLNRPSMADATFQDCSWLLSTPSNILLDVRTTQKWCWHQHNKGLLQRQSCLSSDQLQHTASTSREIQFCANILKISLKNANHFHHSQLCYSSSSSQTN